MQSLTISHQCFGSVNLDTVTVRSLCSLVRIFSAKCEHLSLGLVAHPNIVRPI